MYYVYNVLREMDMKEIFLEINEFT